MGGCDKLRVVVKLGKHVSGRLTANGTRLRDEQLHDCAPRSAMLTRVTFLEYATAGSTVSSASTWRSNAWHSTSQPRKSNTP